jgi:hypothetical protein
MVGYLNVKSAGYRGFFKKTWGISCRNKKLNLFFKDVADFSEGFDAMPQCEVM